MRFGFGELGPFVHLECLDGVRRDNRGDPVAGVVENSDRVGQVVLAERVVRPEPTEGWGENALAEAVYGGRDLVDLAFLLGRLRVVDDTRHPPVLVPDDSRVAARPVQPRREQRGRPAAFPVALDEGRERRAPEKRGVAGQHDDVTLVEVGEPVGAEKSRERDRDGVAGTARLGLFDELEGEPVGRLGLDGLCDLGCARADDHDNPVHDQLGERVENIEDHRSPTEAVQRLGGRGLHSSAFSCSEDDGRQRTELHALLSTPWRAPPAHHPSSKEQRLCIRLSQGRRCSRAMWTTSGSRT